MRPLDDMKIIGIVQYGAGPFALMQLADLGAEVIKIEDPGTRGDVARRMPPYVKGNDSIYFQSFNRGFKSLALDINKKEGKEIFHRLVRESDAVFNNLRGDLPEKIGITYEELKVFNPKIVCCSLTGWGRSGSKKREPGYDFLVQAYAGYMSVTGEPNSPPQRCGVSVIDFATSYAAAFALLVGIHRARTTGVGCDIDVSLFDVAISMLNYIAAWNLNEGYEPVRTENSAHQAQVPVQLFETADGHIFIFCGKEKFYRNLCELIGRDDLATNEKFVDFNKRYENRRELISVISEAIRRKTTKEWIEVFHEKVPCAEVNTIPQALRTPLVTENEMIVEVDSRSFGALKLVNSPIKISDGIAKPAVGAPQYGEHTRQILYELGYHEEEIIRLKNLNVIDF